MVEYNGHFIELNLFNDLTQDYVDFCEVVEQQFHENIAKWGLQEIKTLLIVAMEKLGKLSQAVLHATHEGKPEEHIFDELIDLSAVLPAIHFVLRQKK